MKKAIILLWCLATLFKVADAQWTAIDSGSISAVWLVQPNDGWAFENNFRHWDGTNWTTVIQDSAFGAETCAFTAPDDGWVFGAQDSLYRYNGSVWTKQYSGMPGIKYCDFYDSNHGWLLGADTTYYYQNGVWTKYPLFASGQIPWCQYTSISASSASTAWMTGPMNVYYPGTDSSYILKFTSGQWAIDTAFFNINLYSISFTDQNHGWAYGWDIGNGWQNVIYKYNGSNWTVDTILGATPENFGYIYMYNNLGWVSFSTVSGNLIYGYNGYSWSYQCAIEQPVKQFSFVDPMNGWALGINLDGHPSSGPRNILFNTLSGGLGSEEFDQPESSEINMYPNPATDKISITCPHQQNLSLSIYNIFGALILTNELSKTKNEIDISNFSKGIYIIKIASADRTVLKKIVKE